MLEPTSMALMKQNSREMYTCRCYRLPRLNSLPTQGSPTLYTKFGPTMGFAWHDVVFIYCIIPFGLLRCSLGYLLASDPQRLALAHTEA